MKGLEMAPEKGCITEGEVASFVCAICTPTHLVQGTRSLEQSSRLLNKCCVLQKSRCAMFCIEDPRHPSASCRCLSIEPSAATSKPEASVFSG